MLFLCFSSTAAFGDPPSPGVDLVGCKLCSGWGRPLFYIVSGREPAEAARVVDELIAGQSADWGRLALCHVAFIYGI